MDYSENHNLVGKKLGPYEVKSRLGSGGMGVVYLGYDAALERHVALKTLAQAFITNESWRARFHREAKAVAQLRHPNIVQVYGMDLESVPPFIAMEFIQGMSLDALLRDKGALTWQQALHICMQVVSALGAAHEKGVIHRDVKPGNILVDGKWNAHVSDFGVAKVLESNTQLTASGAMIGTPQYMSPEQFGAGEVGPQSDLFSLGVVTFEMITGQLPFKADTPAGLVKQITLEPPDTSLDRVQIPTPVKQFVTALLQKDPSQRYPSAKVVLQDLRQLQKGQPLLHGSGNVQVDLSKSMIDDLLGETTKKAPAPIPRKTTRRSPLLVVGIVSALLIAFGGITAFAFWGADKYNSSRQNRPQFGNIEGRQPQQPTGFSPGSGGGMPFAQPPSGSGGNFTPPAGGPSGIPPQPFPGGASGGMGAGGGFGGGVNVGGGGMGGGFRGGGAVGGGGGAGGMGPGGGFRGGGAMGGGAGGMGPGAGGMGPGGGFRGGGAMGGGPGGMGPGAGGMGPGGFPTGQPNQMPIQGPAGGQGMGGAVR